MEAQQNNTKFGAVSIDDLMAVQKVFQKAMPSAKQVAENMERFAEQMRKNSYRLVDFVSQKK